MIRLNQVKLPVTHKDEEITAKVCRILRISEAEILSVKIVKQSLDARKKDQICYSYTLDVTLREKKKETNAVRNGGSQAVLLREEETYTFPGPGTERLSHPPVIVGSGPAGLFCGYMLAQAGYCPVILERGDDVDTRKQKVEQFWADGTLDTRCNVQFGEGGAGTFSDGKLNTLVKDPKKRNQKVLEIFVEHGADPAILYLQKPHIGTDVLSQVVKNIRKHIEELGGTVRFGAQVTDILMEQGAVRGVEVTSGDSQPPIPGEALILAVGHSARDTFSMLLNRGVFMQPKAFAVGLRIQHPQEMINQSQYGPNHWDILGPASYKVTHQASTGRGVYSFCMCPGGYVVNASSEAGRLAVNGMSNHDRGGQNANSALIVTVTPEDFGDVSPMAGVEYQRKLEALAYECGNGKIPIQLYGDFKENRISCQLGDVAPEFKGETSFANLREMLPGYLSDSLIEGVEHFENMIRGFSRHDSILAGVESRTSSPLRILRNSDLESDTKGLFPCGEGAGYAGGITSAAMDGIKVAEEIARRFGRPVSLENL